MDEAEPKEVLIDLDGVVADFTSAALEIANRYAGTAYNVDDVKTWELFDLPGLKAVEDLVWGWIREPGFARSLKVYPDAEAGVALFQLAGPVRILTSPVVSPTFVYDRTRWVEDVLGIHWKHIVYTYSKEVVCGRALIDDKPENVIAWLNRQPGKAILWAQSYNQAAFETEAFSQARFAGRVIRTNSWGDAFGFIYDCESIGVGP